MAGEMRRVGFDEVKITLPFAPLTVVVDEDVPTSSEVVTDDEEIAVDVVAMVCVPSLMAASDVE